MKKHPDVVEDLGGHRKSLSDQQELINQIVRQVESDENDRTDWGNRQATYYRRRYVREDRNVNWPWPGASDIVMPTIDMTIDRLKSTLSRVIFTRPMVNFVARNPASSDRVHDARTFFSWLLNEGMPDFREEVFTGLDSMLQHGFAIFKVFWDFQTRRVTRVLNRNDMPRDFSDIVPGLSETEANALFRQTGRLAASNQQFAAKIDAERELIEVRLRRKYGLDKDEPEDEKALSKIIQFLKTGQEQVTFKSRQVLENRPRVITVDPQDFIVPKTTNSVENAIRCTHRLWLDESTFKARARDRGWSKKAIDLVLNERNESRNERSRNLRRTTLDSNRNDREGLHYVGRDEGAELIEVWEHYCRMDIDGDGQDELVVMPIHPGTNTLLRDIREVPFEHNKFPFVQLKFEMNDPRFYSSRGVPEKLDDIDLEITKRHRNKLNNMDLMVPTFTYRFGSELNPDTFSFIPGEMYPVVNHDDLAPIPIPDRTITDEREENILLTWNERYLGGLDVNLAAQANIAEARTATEIEAIQQSAALTLGYRGEVLQVGMKKVYGMIWDLWNQWGPEETYIRVTGRRMKRLTKEEIQGDFDIVPVGTVDTSSPQAEAQKAFIRMQTVMAIVQQLGPDPLGPRYELNIAQVILDWLRKDDFVSSETFVRERSPEEIQQLVQKAQEQQALVEAAETGQPITPQAAQKLARDVEKNLPRGTRIGQDQRLQAAANATRSPGLRSA